MDLFTNFSTCTKGQALRASPGLPVVLLNKQLICVSNFTRVDIDKRTWCLCLYILAQCCLNTQMNFLSTYAQAVPLTPFRIQNSKKSRNKLLYVQLYQIYRKEQNKTKAKTSGLAEDEFPPKIDSCFLF